MFSSLLLRGKWTVSRSHLAVISHHTHAHPPSSAIKSSRAYYEVREREWSSVSRIYKIISRTHALSRHSVSLAYIRASVAGQKHTIYPLHFFNSLLPSFFTFLCRLTWHAKPWALLFLVSRRMGVSTSSSLHLRSAKKIASFVCRRYSRCWLGLSQISSA